MSLPPPPAQFPARKGKKPPAAPKGKPQALPLESGVPILCAHSRLVPIEEVTPNPRNPNRHPEAQLELLAKIIRASGFRSPIVVSSRSGFVTKGHGRLEAARRLGMTRVPIDYQAYGSEAEEWADMVADNRLAELAEMDPGALKDLLQELDTGALDMELTGYSEAALADLMSAIAGGAEMEEGEAKAKLAERFIVPPFSILDTRAGYWQQRKKAWRAIIKDYGESRKGLVSLSRIIVSKYGKKGLANTSILDPILAELSCQWFLPTGAGPWSVFDCFAGDTVFGFVSAKLGHRFTGIELRKEQAALNQKRCDEAGIETAEYICDDGRNLAKHIKAGSQDLFFSCPPYLDLEEYSDDPRDISHMSHAEAFGVFRDVFKSVFAALKAERFAVLVIGEVRRPGGAYAAFVPELIQAMQAAGFAYYNEAILVNSIGTAAIWAARAMNTSRKLTKVHQNVLVFFKGDLKRIPKTFGPFINDADMAEQLQTFVGEEGEAALAEGEGKA